MIKGQENFFRNIDDDGWLPAAHFFVIFGKKYNIHIYKGEYWGNRNESFAIEFPSKWFLLYTN